MYSYPLNRYKSRYTARFIKPCRDPVYKCTSVRFYRMGDIITHKTYILLSDRSLIIWLLIFILYIFFWTTKIGVQEKNIFNYCNIVLMYYKVYGQFQPDSYCKGSLGLLVHTIFLWSNRSISINKYSFAACT